MALFVPMLALLLLLGLLGPAIDGLGRDVAAVLAASCLTLGASVAILNRPRILVPPHLRDEPGLLRDLRES